MSAQKKHPKVPLLRNMALVVSVSGIRGIVGGQAGDGFTPFDVMAYGVAYARYVKEHLPTLHTLVLGRDARPSGIPFASLLSATWQAMGYDVLDLGLSTTPTVAMYIAQNPQVAGGVIISASHNPSEWNALKLFDNHGELLSERAGTRIQAYAAQQDASFATYEHLGTSIRIEDAIEKHIDAILQLPLVDAAAIASRDFRIGIDATCSTGGIAVPLLLERLGITHLSPYACEPTGLFPHSPEPLPENLSTLSEKVRQENLDLGIAVDPDVDRLVFVCENGKAFGEEYTLVAVADYVLRHEKGACVSNFSSSMALSKVSETLGCAHVRSSVGEVHVVRKMKACQAIIGGEGNGGIIYPPLHYGRDALVGIALFLSHLAREKIPISMLRARYPSYYLSKNKIACPKNLSPKALEQLLKDISKQYQNYPQEHEDGVYIRLEKAWIHVRRSNTEPIIRVYTEASLPEKAHALTQDMLEYITHLLDAYKQP